MNRTYLGPDASKDNWFFQISTDSDFNHHWKSHFVTLEFGSALQVWKATLCYGDIPKDLPEGATKFLTQARELFAKVPNSDALENSEAFCALVDVYVKKQKMVLVTNNGRVYDSTASFNFVFGIFESTYIFHPAFEHKNSFGLTFSGVLTPDEPLPGSNHTPDDDLPVILQIFTRVIRRKTVLHAQLSRLGKRQIPNKPPAFEVLFQMEYK